LKVRRFGGTRVRHGGRCFLAHILVFLPQQFTDSSGKGVAAAVLYFLTE